MSGFKIFQFHKGTIKTEEYEKRKRENRIFQFHKGTIKTLIINLKSLIKKISIP